LASSFYSSHENLVEDNTPEQRVLEQEMLEFVKSTMASYPEDGNNHIEKVTTPEPEGNTDLLMAHVVLDDLNQSESSPIQGDSDSADAREVDVLPVNETQPKKTSSSEPEDEFVLVG
jgi:hypothetical protein